MKTLILSTLLLYTVNIKAQDFIYKRNYSGEIDVYSKQNGVIQALPIGTFSRNVYGYVEFKSRETVFYKQSNEQVDLPPKIEPIVPQFESVTSVVNTLNVYLNLIKIQSQQKKQSEVGINNLKTLFSKMNMDYMNLTDFYNQLSEKPKEIRNGWHNITVTSNPNEAGIILNNKKMVEVGYALVKSNKIQDIILCDWSNGMNFSNPPIITSNSITECKSFYKRKNSASTDLCEVYFLDYLLDSNSSATVPPLGKCTFTISPSIPKAVVGIFKQNPKVYGETGDNWIGLLILARTREGKLIESVNVFTSYPGTYYYKAIDELNHEWIEPFTLSSDSKQEIKLGF